MSVRSHARTEPAAEGFVHVLDPDQSSTECYARGLAVLAIVTAYFTYLFQRLMPSFSAPLTILLGFCSAWFTLNVSFFIMAVPILSARRAGLIEQAQSTSLQTMALESIVILASAWACLQEGWVRFPGAAWLTLVLCNGLAYVAVTLLGPKIREVEARLGGNEFVS